MTSPSSPFTWWTGPPTYLVDWSANKMALLSEGIDRAAGRLAINPVKLGTLIGVAALSEPGFLVEVDAIAVLP